MEECCHCFDEVARKALQTINNIIIPKKSEQFTEVYTYGLAREYEFWYVRSVNPDYSQGLIDLEQKSAGLRWYSKNQGFNSCFVCKNEMVYHKTERAKSPDWLQEGDDHYLVCRNCNLEYKITDGKSWD